MKKEDLDALASLYEGVYSPEKSGEYLSEEYLSELQLTGFGGKPLNLPKPTAAQKANELKFQQRAAAYKAKGGSNYAAYLAGGGDAGRKNMQAGRAGTIAPQDVERQGRANLKAKAAKDRIANASQADKNKAAENVFGLKPGSLSRPAATTPAAKPGSLSRPAATTPAAKPAGTRPAGTSPATRPATPGAGAKVAPTAAAKPAGQTGDKAKDMATWAKANPTLANKPKTPNPLMQKTFGYQTGNAPDQIKAASAGANPAKAAASFARSKETANKLGLSGSVKALTSGYEWGTKATLKDVADAYASIYEAKKKKDQDQDGDTDFADVQIARMIASGMSRAEAIAAVRNKEYNEEFELDEATRMRKELGKEGEIRVRGELAARSRAHKRSDSVDKTIAAAERGANRPYIKHKRGESDADRKKREEKQSRTLRGLASSRRGSVRDNPRAGMRGYAAKVEGSDKDLQTARQRAMSAGTLTPKEKKQLGEEYEIYEIVASYLLENNFAETLNDANAIIENMSENWLEEIIEQSAIASRTAAVVDDQRRGSHGMAHDQKMTGDSIKKLNRYKGPRVTPGLPGA